MALLFLFKAFLMLAFEKDNFDILPLNKLFGLGYKDLLNIECICYYDKGKKDEGK
jgi:hypothetical protein